jgi:hypothetical protein
MVIVGLALAAFPFQAARSRGNLGPDEMITGIIDTPRIVGGDVDVEAKALNVQAHVFL